MSEPFILDLVETPKLTTKVTAHVSQAGKVDTKRELIFNATFELIDADEFDDIMRNSGKRAAVERVLVEVDGIPGGKAPDGTELTPVQVACRHPQVCDALWGTYLVKNSENSREIIGNAAERGNSKRSRGR